MDSEILKQIKQQNKKYEEWENGIEGIGYQINGDLDNIPDYAQYVFLRALSYLPKSIRDRAISESVFLGDNEDNTGSYHSFGNKIFENKKGFIYFSPLLWSKKPIEIDFCIAHEIAHCINDHKFKMDENFESFKQEKEADKLAIKWLKGHYKKEKLLKICSYFKNPKWEKWGNEAKRKDEEYKKIKSIIKSKQMTWQKSKF